MRSTLRSLWVHEGLRTVQLLSPWMTWTLWPPMMTTSGEELTEKPQQPYLLPQVTWATSAPSPVAGISSCHEGGKHFPCNQEGRRRWKFFAPDSTWASIGKLFTPIADLYFQSEKSLSRVRLFVIPGTVAHQAPPSMGFSRQECWSGLPFPFPKNLPNPEFEPRSPALQADSLPSKPAGKLPYFPKQHFMTQTA